MTLTLELPPELEIKLQEAAARRGQDLETFARAALAEVSDRESSSATAQRPSFERFEAAMDELSAGGEKHIRLKAEDFSRDSFFYSDHD